MDSVLVCYRYTVFWWIFSSRSIMVKEKRSAMIMNKTEIYEMAMQEMIEENLRLRRKSCTEQEKKQYENVSALAEQIHAIAQKECEYLYAQGVRDGIELLKKLNIF